MGKRGTKPPAPQPLVIDAETGAAVFTIKPRSGETYTILIDAEDLPLVNGRSWTPVWQKHRPRCCDGRQNHNQDHVYFYTTIRLDDGKTRRVSMHRRLVGSHQFIPRGGLVQFRDHRYFDLRKSQLRISTQGEVNQRMRKTSKPTHSNYKGVSFESRGSRSRWTAQAWWDGGVLRIAERTGNDPDAELKCARAYDCFVLANFDNPNPNFPASDYTVAQIAAYKRERKPITSAVLDIKPSPNLMRRNRPAYSLRRPPSRYMVAANAIRQSAA